MISCVAFAEEELHVVIPAATDLHGNIRGCSYEDGGETANDGMNDWLLKECGMT